MYACIYYQCRFELALQQIHNNGVVSKAVSAPRLRRHFTLINHRAGSWLLWLRHIWFLLDSVQVYKHEVKACFCVRACTCACMRVLACVHMREWVRACICAYPHATHRVRKRGILVSHAVESQKTAARALSARL